MPDDVREITVVIPTYSRTDLLEECLESLSIQTFKDFSVIVVDDGSERGVPEAVSRAMPKTIVIRRERNGGFARAVNTGIRAANSPLVLLLNDDMTLAPNCLELLRSGLIESGAAIAGPLVLFKEGPDIVYSLGDRIRKSGRPESIGFRCPLTELDYNEKPFGVSAGAVLIRREVFDSIGLFDEQFGAYFEDADLCFRARAAGFGVAIVRTAVTYHVGSASMEGKGWWRSRQCCRNHVLLVVKNYPAPLLAKFAGKIAREHAHQCRRVVSAGRTEFGLLGALALLLPTWIQIVAAMPHALIARVKIQRARASSIAAIDNMLEE
jgi:hypothetical protein